MTIGRRCMKVEALRYVESDTKWMDRVLGDASGKQYIRVQSQNVVPIRRQLAV